MNSTDVHIVVEAHCYALQCMRINCEQIRSRINQQLIDSATYLLTINLPDIHTYVAHSSPSEGCQLASPLPSPGLSGSRWHYPSPSSLQKQAPGGAEEERPSASWPADFSRAGSHCAMMTMRDEGSSPAVCVCGGGGIFILPDSYIHAHNMCPLAIHTPSPRALLSLVLTPLHRLLLRAW